MVWYTKCKHKMVKPYSKPSQHPFRDSQETNQSQSNPQAVEPEPAEEGVHCLGSKLHAKCLHDLNDMWNMWTCFLNDTTMWSFFVRFDIFRPGRISLARFWLTRPSSLHWLFDRSKHSLGAPGIPQGTPWQWPAHASAARGRTPAHQGWCHRFGGTERIQTAAYWQDHRRMKTAFFKATK